MASKWLIVPDLQVPDHDTVAIRNVLAFIDFWQPDGVAFVGDELDAPEPSRWNKGYAGEYAGTLQKGIDTCHDVLASFREAAPEARMILMRSNHGERIRTYINRYAPALGSLRSLDYESLMGFEELGIEYFTQPYEFAPGFVLAHGDEGSLSQTAAGTAMGLAKKWGKSCICGHTHRAGVQHQHLVVNGKVTTHLYGIETGHLMDIRKANYLKAGSANWQQAITLVEVDGKVSHPTLLLMRDRKINYNGRVFG